MHIQVVNFEQSRVALKWLTKYGVGKDLLAHPDDHAVIMQVGHLDCLDFAPDSLQQTGAHLDQMLKVLSENGIPVLVVGTGVLATCASDYDKVGYQQMFGDLATKYDALFYENLLDGVAGNPDLLLPDGGGSPNASGDAVIAVRLLPFVEKLVARAQKP